MVFLKKISDFLKYLNKTNIFAYSAQVAFYFTLALFPLLYIIVKFTALFSVSSDMVLDMLYYMFPKEAYNIIFYDLKSLSDTGSVWGLVSSALIAFFSASLFIHSLKTALRLGIREKSPYSFWVQRGISVLITMVFALAIQFSIVFASSLNIITGFVTRYFGMNFFTGSVSMIIAALIFLVDLVLLYMFIPSKRISFMSALPGAVIAEILFVLSLGVYSYYVSRIADYSIFYGALSSVIVLIVWLYVCSLILLFGGFVNNYILKNKEK